MHVTEMEIVGQCQSCSVESRLRSVRINECVDNTFVCADCYRSYSVKKEGRYEDSDLKNIANIAGSAIGFLFGVSSYAGDAASEVVGRISGRSYEYRSFPNEKINFPSFPHLIITCEKCKQKNRVLYERAITPERWITRCGKCYDMLENINILLMTTAS